ncbi:MAG: sugar ABC transporter permease [Anaerolineae bacterium]|nr:sugar ABC transporter permease [Anaerolineae bacterium]
MTIKEHTVTTPGQGKKNNPKRRGLLYQMRKYKIAYAFIAPAVLVMLLVHLIPSAQAIYMSFLDLNTSTLLQYLRAPFVGLQHYQHILKGLISGEGDSLIRNLTQAIKNSFIFLFWVQGGTLVFGLILALLLNRDFRGRGLARTLVLLPWVVPTFVVGIIWQFIWLQKGGLANRILFNWLHVVDKPVSWLLLKNARTALIIPAIWSGVPFMTVMLLSALQVVPDDLYEAASMDGATSWQKFRHITLPFLKPVIVINMMFGIVFNFFGFGPYNIAVSLFSSDKLGRFVNLLTIAIVQQTFNNQLYGYGAAASVLMMVVALIFVGIWYRLFRSSMVSE